MWNDPIVEETRRLRDEYSARHSYNIHAIVEDLRQWEHEGFPMPANIHKTFQPTILPVATLRQDEENPYLIGDI
uniref:Uncharacterized protein n=1 Tax=Candidatus Kentrum sp. MB TaxID=2138164 RepID=A0A451BF20_9GAMM|nr:MAG: hypothetical protein BECKMB1821H_GA0114242_108011 [Candidatus Kentron sp. MB]